MSQIFSNFALRFAQKLGMKDHISYWNECLDIIRDNVSPQVFRTWFEPIVPASIDDEKIILQVPSAYFVEFIETNYIHLLQQVLYRVIRPGIKLEYRARVDSEQGRDITTASEHNEPAGGSYQPIERSGTPVVSNPFLRTQLPPLDPQLNSNYSFGSLVEGECNKLARVAGITIADKPGNNAFNPLFVFGESGVGKTHLVQAIGNRAKEQNPSCRVLYVAASTFQQQYTTAHLNQSLNDFLSFYQTIDLLIIDDIQEFAGKTGTQKVFFNIFNALHTAGKQLVLTSDRPPVALAGMEQRMLSRFKWGLSAEIKRPDFQLRKNILLNKIERDGLEISDEIVDYIAHMVRDNIRDLEGILTSLMANSVLLNRPIDMQLATTVVSRLVDVRAVNAKDDELSPHRITTEELMECVIREFHVSKDDILSSCRTREVAQARQVLMFLMKKYTKSAYTQIGAQIGGRSHATAMHACTVISDQISVDQDFRKRIESLEESIK